MKFSSLAVSLAMIGSVSAEIFFKEQFNDEVRRFPNYLAITLLSRFEKDSSN